jgi:hypothetical protein
VKVQISRASDVPELCLSENAEYSHRLITRARNNSERMSFHVTRYAPAFNGVMTGDGIHEYVLFCLSGSAELESDEGWKALFDNGAALCLGTEYSLRLRVSDSGLHVAVACVPPAE